MAFSNSTSDRMDELRFRSQQSPRSDAQLLGLISPPRSGRLSFSSNQMHDGRVNLTRRFTTDSSRIPTFNMVTSPRAQDGPDYATYHKVQLLEKKKLEYERLREQKRRFEAEMQLLDLQQRQEERELVQMQQDLGRVTGNHSEPTTPPEFRDSGFPSVFSRPNRYSASNIASPPGVITRPNRSGSQLTSPPSGFMSRFMMDEAPPFRSVPVTRRNSDDEKSEAVRQDPTSHLATNALHRYSMPVTKSRNGVNEMFSIDQTNTARFLFGDDDQPVGDSTSFLQMQSTDDKFPILVRRDEFPGVLSASSAALDLATSPSPGPENQHGWSSVTRHRPQQSLPMNTYSPFGATNGTPATTSIQNAPTSAESPISRPTYRSSVDLKYFNGDGPNDGSLTSPVKHVPVTPPKLQSSYSTSDIPTVKSNSSSVSATPNNHAQQHLHNHNASMGRIPLKAVSNRHSRDLSNGENPVVTQGSGFQSIQSALQANAPSFGPAISQPASTQSQAPALSGVTSAFVPGFYNGYNMQMMAMNFQNMQLGQQMYNPQNAYANFPAPYQQQNGARDSQARVIQQRRQNDGEAMNRFANLPLEQLGGDIYNLCKDQHGCRYLQKKLEDRLPEQIHMIWLETNPHVVELMTDPFGNYLCQKLLEYCNDEERTVLIENASRDLVRIALNQHGTRALQKMIEFVSTPGQIQTIINALRYQVVELIQDLNGNHVIQKCLNKLSSADAQFIFDAVGTHCVDVGTHRHGCCVLQRCIDHASGDQKTWLIRQISNNAFVLVQDPFGNYVVQYILDLNEPIYTEPLIQMFEDRIPQLSRQKFSSNVIEKCLRCAQDVSKDKIIEEMLVPAELERLLRDSFANYVIQTALDYANATTRQRLVDAIRPYLPAIRSTPYGRRIQAKIQGTENRPNSGASSGQATPSENTNGQVPLARTHQRSSSSISSNTAFNTGSFANGFTHGNGVTVPSSRPSSQHSTTNGQSGAPNFSFNAYGRGNAQPGVGNYF